MPDIVDPIAIKWCNEHLRPICEELRNSYAILTDAVALWTNDIGARIPDEPWLLDDERESQGVSRLTGEEINDLVDIIVDLLAVLDVAGIMDQIRHACVRKMVIGSS